MRFSVGGVIAVDAERDPQSKVSQVTGNFNKIARDLDRAIALARFHPLQQLLLQQAREASWSWRGPGQEALPFRLNLSQIARETDCNRSWLNQQFRALVEAAVFVEVADEPGSYLINKDFRLWRDERGRERLSPVQVGWALAARRKKKGSAALVGAPTSALQPTNHPLVGAPTSALQPTNHPLVGAPTSALQPTNHPEPSPLVPPSRNARREINSEKERDPEREGEGDPSPPGMDSSPFRAPEDLACINRAERLLAADPRTEAIALQLGRLHSLPGAIAIDGWKWERAAQRLLSPELDDAKRKWHYLVGIARNLTEADRAEKPPAKRESAAERKRREMKESIERMKDKERKEREHAG